jgi:hypothetical protein
VPTQLVCADTREHAAKLARSGVRLVEKRRPRGAGATHVHRHERARQLTGEKWCLVY